MILDYFTSDLDDALALAVDFNDAVALVRREITALKKNYYKYGILNLNPINASVCAPVEHTLRYSTG